MALQLGSLCSQPIFDSPIHDAHNSIPDVHILLRTRGIFSGTAMTRPDGQPKLPEAVSGRPLAYPMPKSREKGSGKRGWGLNLFPYPNSLSTPPVSGSAPRTTKFAEAAMTRAGEACAAIMAKTGKLKPLELAKLNKESGTSQPIAAHRNPSRHIATHRGPSQPIAAHRHEPTAAHRNPPRHTATPPGAVIKSHTPHQFIKVTQHINSTSELRRYKYNLYLTPQSPPRLGRKFRQFPRRSRTGTTVFPCA